MAVHGAEIERAQQGEARGRAPRPRRSIESMRADYEQQLDAQFAAARGYVDAIVTPEETRDQLAFRSRYRCQLRRSAPRSVRPAAARRGRRALSRWRRVIAALACAVALPGSSADVPPVAARRAGRHPSRTSIRGRGSSPGARFPRPTRPPPPKPAEDAGRAHRASRGWPTPTAGCRSPAPASTSSVDAHPDASTDAGVLIGILDTGIDPAIPGLGTHLHRRPQAARPARLLGRGRGAAHAGLAGRATAVAVGGRTLARVRPGGRPSTPRARSTPARSPSSRSATRPPSDLNGNGAVGDTLVLVVTRATDGWVVLADTDGDGSLGGRTAGPRLSAGPRDVRLGAAGDARRRIAMAANFGEAGGEPDARSGVRPSRTRHRTSPGSPRRTTSTASRASTAWRPARSCSASRSPTARRAASPRPAPCCARWTTPSGSRRPGGCRWCST